MAEGSPTSRWVRANERVLDFNARAKGFWADAHGGRWAFNHLFVVAHRRCGGEFFALDTALAGLSACPFCKEAITRA